MRSRIIMCGIFAVIGDQKTQAAQTTLDALKKLEYRGYDSWGIAAITQNGQLLVDKHPGKIGDATTSLPASAIALGHTRWATHGGVTQTNAHPHLDCSGRIAVIHNGIVDNFLELKDRLVREKHVFKSETDTEVIAHLVEEELKAHDFKTAVFEAFGQLSGANAIVVIDQQSHAVVACKNSSPLLLGLSKSTTYLASDAVAFLEFTRKVYILNDGEGIIITPNTVKLYDLASQAEKKYTMQTLTISARDIDKGTYPHYLLKEIHEQPEIVTRIAKKTDEEFQQAHELVSDATHIALIGCGTAYHCALISEYLFAQKKILTHAYQAHEFHRFSPLYTKKSVVIAISQSGETIDTLLAAKSAQRSGAKVIAVVNARGSSLERLADVVLAVDAGPEISVVSSKAFVAQVTTLLRLIQNDKNSVLTVAQGLQKLFTQHTEKQVQSVAHTLVPHEHLYIIGKDLNYPAALEIALKLKETSYLHAEAFAAGELKHGVLSLITTGIPCIALISNDDVAQDTISNGLEISARGGMMIGLGPTTHPSFQAYLQIPDLGQYTFLLHIVVGQLLAYYLGVARGADPDKPRNLAKSVTVK